jgi:hypothetical protein
MEQALVQEAGMAAQDIRDVTNIHEANMGETSNEVSGRAIMARQRVGEVGTVIYQDNLNTAIEEAGGVINSLIPFVYDTARLIKVLGEDMKTEELVPINGMTPDSVDITMGKYSVSVTTGPSYTTRRVEAREEMMAMVNAMPNVLGVAADLIAEAQDWPGADKIASRLRSQLPPGMIEEKDMDDAARQQQAAAQQAQAAQEQLQQQIAALEMAGKQAEIEEKQAKTRLAIAQAEKAESDAMLAEANTHLAIAKARAELAGIGQREREIDNEERNLQIAGNGASDNDT